MHTHTYKYVLSIRKIFGITTLFALPLAVGVFASFVVVPRALGLFICVLLIPWALALQLHAHAPNKVYHLLQPFPHTYTHSTYLKRVVAPIVRLCFLRGAALSSEYPGTLNQTCCCIIQNIFKYSKVLALLGAPACLNCSLFIIFYFLLWQLLVAWFPALGETLPCVQ